MMILLQVLKPLQIFNDIAGRLGRALSVGALALMVVVILLQVFFRYVLNSAMPWPDEAARFMMLWLTGLMAPIALRQGGFVAIDTIAKAIPRRAFEVLSLGLFLLSLLVSVIALQLGWKHVNSGWLFASASLKLPLQLIGLKAMKIKLAWMYLSLFTGACLMLAVNVELILRQVITLANQADKLRPLSNLDLQGSE